MEFSQRQKDVIEANDKVILVSASAGSGKTTVMIERIMRLINDGVPLKKIFVSTFTKAAALDMKRKMFDRLRALGRQEEIAYLPQSDITNLHSFCQRIINADFYVAGVDPSFEVIDEFRASKLLSESLDFVFERMKAENNADFNELRQKLSTRRNDNRLKGMIMRAFRESENYPEPEEWLSQNGYDRKKTEDGLQGIFEARRLEISQKLDILKLYCDNEGMDCDGLIECMKEYLHGRLTKSPPISAKVTGVLLPLFKYIRDEIAKLNKLMNTQYLSFDCAKRFVDVITHGAIALKREYERRKQERAQLDFSDLEHYAYKILLSEDGINIKKRYDYVFVDEYQDINPMQERIINELVSTGANLFMVGDVKQSIYAFRGCKPEIFARKYMTYKREGGGRCIDLTDNYRSGRNIIDYVNDVFVRLMTGENAPEYAKNPMTAITDGGEVVMNLVESDKQPKPSGIYSVKNDCTSWQKNESEINLVVNGIADLLDKDVRPGDIAVLTRAADDYILRLKEKLDEVGIPVVGSRKINYLSEKITRQLIDFLRLIDNFCDDIAMAKGMLSHFGKFTESELSTLAADIGEERFYERVLSSNDDKVAAFVQKIRRYDELKAKLAPDELCGLIVSENEYFNYAYSLGEDDAIILDRFLSYVSETRETSLYELLKTVDRNEDVKSEGNKVKVMTIHASKGLEFPYVFLVNMSKSFNLTDLYAPMLFTDEGIALSAFEDKKVETDYRLLIAQNAEKRQLEEEIRLLYVAMTRAKAGLYMFATGCDSFVQAAMMTKNDLPSPVLYSSAHSQLKLCAHAGRIKHCCHLDITCEFTEAKVPPSNIDEVEAFRRKFDFVCPPAPPSKSYVTKLAKSLLVGSEEDEIEGDVIFSKSEGSQLGGGGIERGTAYHKAMEELDWSSPDFSSLSEDVRAFIDERKVARAVARMQNFSCGYKIYREQPFIYKMKNEGGDTLLQGVIDCLLVRGDQAVVVDYKTGRSGSKFEEGYCKQLELYAEAVEKLLGLTVSGKFLYYLDFDEWKEVK